MKTVLFAAAILTAVVVFVGWCSWYMEEVCVGMRNLLEAMPGGEERDLGSFSGSYRAAEKYWLSRKLWIQMIIGKKQMEEVSSRLVEAGMRYIGGDMTGYRTVKEGLKLYLEQLREGETISWEGIM